MKTKFKVLNAVLVALSLAFLSGFIFLFETRQFLKHEKLDHIRKGTSVYDYSGRLIGWFVFLILCLAVNLVLWGGLIIIIF